MTDVTQLSNVDLLDLYGDEHATAGWSDTFGPARTEILRRMDAGIGNRDDVAVEPSEHQR